MLVKMEEGRAWNFCPCLGTGSWLKEGAWHDSKKVDPNSGVTFQELLDEDWA